VKLENLSDYLFQPIFVDDARAAVGGLVADLTYTTNAGRKVLDGQLVSDYMTDVIPYL
jgi:hypothetical protein